MAEHAYLSTRHGPRAVTVHLSAKRRIPIAWALLFAASELDARRSRVETTNAQASRRLRQRAAVLEPHVGPMFRSVLSGFVKWVTQTETETWVLDARELVEPYDDLATLLHWSERLDQSPSDIALETVDQEGDLEHEGDLYELAESGVDGSYPIFGVHRPRDALASSPRRQRRSHDRAPAAGVAKVRARGGSSRQ